MFRQIQAEDGADIRRGFGTAGQAVNQIGQVIPGFAALIESDHKGASRITVEIRYGGFSLIQQYYVPDLIRIVVFPDGNLFRIYTERTQKHFHGITNCQGVVCYKDSGIRTQLRKQLHGSAQVPAAKTLFKGRFYQYFHPEPLFCPD